MKLFFTFLILTQFGLFSKTWTIEDKKYDDELWKIGQHLDQKNAPKGTFVYDKNDFIVAKGKFYKDNPPKSKSSFTYKEKKWSSSGDFNNSILEKLAKKDISYEQAYDMFQTGFSFDSHFLAFRYNLVKVLVAQKKYKQALFHLDFLMNRYPKISKTYVYAGKIYERLQKRRQAHQTYKKCIKISNLYLDCFLALSEYYLKKRKYQNAMKVLRKVPKDAPNYPDVYLGLSKIYLKNGRPNRAYKTLKDLDSYYKKYPKTFHFYLAEASRKVGKLKESKQEYEKFLQYQNDIFFINYPKYRVENRIKKLNK